MRGRILGTLFALENALDQSRNQETVEHLHEGRSRKSGRAQIGGPMQRILELHIFVDGVGALVLREPYDEIGDRFRINGEVTPETLLVAEPGAIDQIGDELPRRVLIAGELPDHRAVGDVRESGHAHPIGPNQRRLQPDLAGDLRRLPLSSAQQADGIGGGRSLAREHGVDVAFRSPRELLRSP